MKITPATKLSIKYIIQRGENKLNLTRQTYILTKYLNTYKNKMQS